MPFKLTAYCRMRSKDGNLSQEGEECKKYGFTAPNGVISTKPNEIAGHFSSTICSQLETLEKRVINL